jgi:acyl-CoA thioester hydrolase
MSRTVIDLPTDFLFSTEIQVCVNDLNIANHVGNDRFVTYINEAYIRFLNKFGLSNETNIMIMADLAVVYKSEAHYGDWLKIDVTVGGFTRKSCNFYYLITNKETEKEVIRAKCGLVFFDYENKKPADIPENMRKLREEIPD